MMKRMIEISLLVGTLYELMYKILFQANKRLSRAVVKHNKPSRRVIVSQFSLGRIEFVRGFDLI